MSVDVAHQFRGEGHLTDVFVSELLKTRVAAQWPSGLPADPVERGAANAPTVVTQKGGDDLGVEARPLAQAEPQRGTPPVTGLTEMKEVRLAFRALIEQVRLVLRDGRRVIRRLIAVCDTSRGSNSVEMTNSPAPLASVPLVVLRSTTEREQIELSDLVQSLSAEGYQVTRRGPQWVVYTEITDRRTSVIGRSPQDGRGTAAISERVRRGSRRQCRSDDRPQ
jgi:hypothetical protein